VGGETNHTLWSECYVGAKLEVLRRGALAEGEDRGDGDSVREASLFHRLGKKSGLFAKKS